MARSTVESCMFCAPNPCTCLEKPKRKLAAKAPIERAPKVQSQTAEPRRVALTSTTAARAAMDEERDLRRAVTTFAEMGMLDSSEVQKHQHLLDMSPTEAKLLIWKLRRQEWLNTGMKKS